MDLVTRKLVKLLKKVNVKVPDTNGNDLFLAFIYYILKLYSFALKAAGYMWF